MLCPCPHCHDLLTLLVPPYSSMLASPDNDWYYHVPTTPTTMIKHASPCLTVTIAIAFPYLAGYMLLAEREKIGSKRPWLQTSIPQ